MTDALPETELYARTRPPITREHARSSHYVTMRDGVRIAVEVYLPRDRDGLRVPAIVCQTRYFRAIATTPLGRLFGDSVADPRNHTLRRYFVDRGYAWVDVDVRGTGASTGTWHTPWSPFEVADGGEVVEWITQQPWSSGRVGTTGNSYDGTAAELLATCGHPALLACAPRCSLYDVYTDIAYPGGVRQAWFTAAWTRANQALDGGRSHVMISEAIAQGYPWLARGLPRRALDGVLGLVFRNVRSVNGETIDRSVREANLDVDAAALAVEFRDDTQPTDLGERTVDTFSPSAYLDRQRAAGVPMLGMSGWFDGAYAHAAIKRHLTLADPAHKLVLGPWNHGLGMTVSPYAPSRRAQLALGATLLRFFDHHLLGRDTGSDRDPAVRYFVMGAEAWRDAPTWPPPQTQPRTLYFAGDRALAWTPGEPGGDTLAHDPEAGSGSRSRWRTLVSPFVVADYPDRVRRDRWLLVYRSAPLVEDLEIAGHPIVELHFAADAADAAVFAYLEDETAEGAVHYVTEGALRLVHRESTGVPGGAAVYASPTPYRSYRRADAQPLPRGERVRVALDLQPVAHRFARGHRIRLALATADADHFAPVRDAATTLAIARGSDHPSALVLPVTLPR